MNPGLGIKSITTNTMDTELLEKAIIIVDKHLDNSKFDVIRLLKKCVWEELICMQN